MVMVKRPNQMPLREARSALVAATTVEANGREEAGRVTACEFTVEADDIFEVPLAEARRG
jgi:hypothetical protein